MEETQSQTTNSQVTSTTIDPQIHDAPNTFIKARNAYDKLQNTLFMQDKLSQKELQTHSNCSSESIIKLMQDKKAIQQRNKIMQFKLDELEKSNLIDFEDKDTCDLVIFLLQKQIKSQQEVQFLGKFIRNLSVFKENQEMLKNKSTSNKIIQNLRCIFIKKNMPLFKYGDRGYEYFILLKGKSYCLIPYPSTVPLELIKQQTRQKRLLPQVTEDHEDEEFLFEHFPRYQCVKIYKPGEAFGEIALLTTENKRMASIICKEDSWFISLDKEGFNEIQGSYQQHLLNEKVYFMKKFEIFKPVAVNKILSFLHEFQEKIYTVGKKIYCQGDRGEKIFFLMEGEVELIREMVSVGTSKLDQQKYQQYFKNTKLTNIQKQIVLLGSNNYFGDEDIISPDRIYSFTAVCKSQNCKILEVEMRILSSFLKVYDMATLFKKTAQNKYNCYQQILQEDIIIDKNKILDSPSSSSKSNQNNINNENNNTSNNSDNFCDEYQFLNTFQTKNQQNLKKSNNKDSPSQKKQNQETKESQKIIKQTVIPKFYNVYTHESNQNIRQKNYLSISNTYQSTAKFTLDDVPMTTKMNQDETDQKRIQFRLSKSICKSQDMKQSSFLHRSDSTSKMQKSFQAYKLGASNSSFDGFPKISNMNSSYILQTPLQQSESKPNQVPIINLNSYDSIKVKEQFDERQRSMQFSLQLKQSIFRDSIHQQLMTPKSQIISSFTPQNCLKHSGSTQSLAIQQNKGKSPRQNSFSISYSQQYTPITHKISKQTNEYQENLLIRQRMNTFQPQNQ
ncbi:hypothetical protein ABPG74_014369 [Tetrahymena malaccensis]